MDRHVAFGRLLAQGRSLTSALLEVDGTVEGITTSAMALSLAAKHRLTLPLVEAVDAVLTGRAPANEALEAVLHRSLDLQ